MIWLAVFAVGLTYLWLWRRSKKNGKRLPPGPKGLPILGSLHLLGTNPHRDLHQLAQKYGPIMYLRLGYVPTIVVSSPQAAQLFLKTHDLIYASRPPLEVAKYIAWGQRNLAFAQYGSYWRNTRKMCTLELLSHAKINSFRPLREEELDLLVKHLGEAANDGVVVDVSAKVAALSADTACRMILGKNYMDQELDEMGFKAVMQELMYLAATPNMGDYIPYIGKLDLQGLIKRMKVMRKIFDEFFDKIIDEHIQSEKGEDEVKDFVDIMLGFVGTEELGFVVEIPNIKAILLDMLAGSIDTSATAIEWTLSETVAQLVHCFDWKLLNDILPADLDMADEFGLTMPRANHLLAKH
ncbi:hypothetical protein VNO80_11436 [Phaseolus coccineus]|uniref:Cytochrome P450 n=1 Tax=Phaseolus coccineus TaxID=3886 RepID=A0AAN9NFC7_PHACN